MKRTWRKKIGAVVALLAAVAVLGTGCGADAAGAVESRTRETRALGLLLSREDTFLSELKADIEVEAAAQGYAVQYYNAGNDPGTQLRQVHEALAEGVETLLVNLADGEDSEKVADIVGDAGVVLLNRAPGTAILNERMVFVGMDEAGAAPSRGTPWRSISGRRTTGRISAICCSRGCPARRIQMPAPAPPCRACWTTASAPSPRRITRSAASAGSGPRPSHGGPAGAGRGL